MTTERPERASQGPSETGSIKTSGIQRVLLVFFGLGVLAVGLILLEGLLSILNVGDPYAVEDPYVGFVEGNDLFHRVEQGGRSMWRTRPEKLSFFNDQSFAIDKPSGTLRIFALGGSTTAGRPYDWRVSFPRWLELLANEAGDRSVEVINAGGVSYASYRITVLMKELVRYEPDAFIIYTGHNEFLEQRTYSDIIYEAAWRRRLRVWSNGLRSLTWARSGIASMTGPKDVTDSGLSAEVEAKLDVWNGLDLFERDEDLKNSVLNHFEHNVRQMSELAEAYGIPILWVRPISNLKDFSPFKSQHSDGWSAPQKQDYDSRLSAGRALLEQGEAADAIDQLEAVVNADPLYAESFYRLGEALFASGRYDQAAESFIRAKDLDVCPLRALEATDEILVRVARETDTPILDLPSMVAERSRARYGHGISGRELLVDHVHPTIEVHRWIASALLDLLEKEGLIEIDSTWDPAAADLLVTRHMGTLDELYYAQRDLNLSKVLGWAGKYKEALEPLERAVQHLYENPEVFRNLGILYQKTGRTADALQAHQRAVELDPSVPESQFNLGVAFAEIGQWQLSKAALNKALELRPEYPEARFNLAIALRESGEIDAAERILSGLSDSEWQNPSMGRQKTLIAVEKARRWIDQARFVDAEKAYRQALGETTDLDLVARIRNDLGVLFGRQNRLQEAEEELVRSIDALPEFAEAHFNLALVYGNGGRLNESRIELERAIELEPGNARYRAALKTLEQSMSR